MKFNLSDSLAILYRTPQAIGCLLAGLSDNWLKNNEGRDTWSPYQVIGHLIHGEKTDWMIRIKIILHDSDDKQFKAFDRFAQMKEEQSKSIESLLEEFTNLRNNNLKDLEQLNILEKDFDKTGIHPEFGEVSLSQLIATWVAHDLGHIVQISRTMAKQYQNAVGLWAKYIRILHP